MRRSPLIASFLYHEVADDPRESGFQRPAARKYRHTTTQFEQNLIALASGQVRPELVRDIDFSRPGRHLLLTFDDGGKSALYAGEQLNRRGWKAHFFIITSAIGTAPFLSLDEIRHLRSCGHVIGSHSHTHPDIFRALSPARMVEQWRVSCDLLSQALGEACTAASVPGGDSSRLVHETAGQAGIRHLFTSDPRLLPRLVSGCWVIGRVCPRPYAPVSRIEALAHFKSWHTELAVRRAKVLLRTVFFPLYRRYVDRTTQERIDGPQQPAGSADPAGDPHFGKPALG
jgi:peptidoglycan/xylan/chitin deacetylase (PgdA/CDA1 family)